MIITRTHTVMSALIATIAAALCLTLFSPDVFALVAADQANPTPETEIAVTAESEATTTPLSATGNARANASTTNRRAAPSAVGAQSKVTLEARAQQRTTNLAANMSNRMEAVIGRLQNIANRLESRLIKLADAGVDTTASAVALASAQLSLDAALAEISDIDAEVYAAFSAPDARTGWNELRLKFITIKNFIKTAHRELRSSITLIKKASLAVTTEQSAEAGTQ